jgi:hypothetical protein
MLETPLSDSQKLGIKKLWPGIIVNFAAGFRFASFRAHSRPSVSFADLRFLR